MSQQKNLRPHEQREQRNKEQQNTNFSNSKNEKAVPKNAGGRQQETQDRKGTSSRQ